MYLRLLLFFLALGLPHFCYASAWTQDKGKTLTQLTTNYYNTGAYFDNSGKRLPMAVYTKEELNPYIEYGLRDGLTIGANLFFDHAAQTGTGATTGQSSWDMGDSEIFARQRLWQGYGFSFAAEPLIKLPSPRSGEQPKIGGNSPDAGLTLASGYSFNAFSLPHYIDIDAGFRHRFGTPHDQMHFDATGSFSITQKWAIMPQIFTTFRARLPHPVVFTQSTSDDYNLIKLQLSVIYSVSDSMYLQTGGFSHVAGRNVGDGDGMMFAIGKKF